jgi:hypothetical protein
MISRSPHETPTCPAIMNITKTTDVSNRLIKAVTAIDKIITYFGKLIFLSRSPLPTIDVTPPTVTSTK